jgi:RNA polymerase sigma factor (TIGR02999 family)
MQSEARESVTQMLRRWRGGDESALQDLMPLVYNELHRRARLCLRREHGPRALQTTELLNETYLRLVDAQSVDWQDRAHFLAIAAKLMRRVLVDEARKRNVRKRGAGLTRVTLDERLVAGIERQADLVALDDALTALECVAARKCRVVELRFFAGLTISETAAVLGVSDDAVKREWRTAKLWLLQALTESQEGSGGDGPRAMATD